MASTVLSEPFVLADLDLPAWLYRLYDADGTLLYVGVTENLRRRLAQHAKKSRWWPLVADKTVQWYAHRSEAEAAEDQAIKDERPVHNRAGADRTRHVHVSNLPTEVPDWSPGEAARIVKVVGRILSQDGLSHSDARLMALHAVLAGTDVLPRGEDLEQLADRCGISRRGAYRALQAQRAAI